jgi:hypothetical protein
MFSREAASTAVISLRLVGGQSGNLAAGGIDITSFFITCPLS